MPRALHALSFLALAAAAPVAAQDNADYSSLVVFGDSLVDAGNINTLIPSVASPEDGYFMGRFTNGYDYTDLISFDLFGEPTTASLQGGTNFAFGGARATTTSAVPDLNEQLAAYQAYLLAGNTVDPNGLYVLNFGGNDVFAAARPGSPAGYSSDSAFLMEAASNYAQAIQSLADLGANNFLITGFPNASPDTIAFAQEAEVYLLSEIGSLSLDGDVDLNFFSYLDFFTRLQADPTAFGLPADLDFNTTCQAAGALPTCEGYFSFDGTHPTAAIHRAAYGEIRTQLGISAPVPEPATWLMMLLGFGFVGGAMRFRKRPQLRTARAAINFG